MDIGELRSFLASPGEGLLHFDEDLLWRFHLAVSSNPMVLLAGLPGAGKTSLAVGYARYRTQDYEGKGHRLIHIRPEWNDSKALMGSYDNQRQEYLSTGFLDIVLAALRNPDKEFYVILDGVDLARPEHYLSDYLAALGREQAVRLHPIERCIPKAGTNRDEANLVCHDLCVKCFFSSAQSLPGHLPTMMSKFVPPMIYFPKNFVVIGTLLAEEWPASLSTSILDRSHLITLDEHSMAEFLTGPAQGMASPKTFAFVCSLEELLREHNLGVGYRIVRQCIEYVKVAEREGLEEQQALDRFAEQRFLPRLINILDGAEGITEKLADLLEKQGLRKTYQRFKQSRNRIARQ